MSPEARAMIFLVLLLVLLILLMEKVVNWLTTIKCQNCGRRATKLGYDTRIGCKMYICDNCGHVTHLRS